MREFTTERAVEDIAGVEVIVYDGTNADEVVAALDLQEGDGVVLVPGMPTLMRASSLDVIRNPTGNTVLIG